MTTIYDPLRPGLRESLHNANQGRVTRADERLAVAQEAVQGDARQPVKGLDTPFFFYSSFQLSTLQIRWTLKAAKINTLCHICLREGGYCKTFIASSIIPRVFIRSFDAFRDQLQCHKS